MEFLENFDVGFIIAVVCCLFGVAVIFAVASNFVGAIFGIFNGLLEMGLNVVTGGPEAWCSCFFVALALAACCGITIFVASVAGSCGTPDAVRFCELFGQG